MSDWLKRSAELMCKSTTDETVYSSCFAGKGDLTYLQWLFHAWGRSEEHTSELQSLV